jgi:hypothetical protein
MEYTVHDGALSYSHHASDRMRQRGITEKEVEYSLNNYHTSYHDAKGNPIYRAVLPSGRNIKVVMRADSIDPRLVITVADMISMEEANGIKA